MLILGWGVQLTLNLGSHFATLLALPLTMLILVGGRSTLNLGSHLATLLGLPLTMLILVGRFDWHPTWEVTLQLCWDYLWQCWSLGDQGFDQHSTWEVTLQLCVGLPLTMLIWGGSQLTLNLGSYFATLLGLLLTMLIVGRGSIDTQLGKSLCNLAGITSDNVDSWGVNWHSTWEVTLQLCWDYLWQCWSRGSQSTLNLGSHFATLLGLPLTMWIWGGGQLDTQLGKLLCNFAGITSDNVDHWGIRGLINTQLWKSLCNFGWDYLLTMLIPGGLIDTHLGRSLCNFAGITSDNVDCGWGSINTQLGRSLCNFAGIISDNVDPWWTGVQLTLNLGSHFATLLGLLLTMLIQGGQ